MVVLPFSTMQMAYHAGNNVDLIGLTGKPDVPISRIQEQVETIIKQNHLIAPNDAQALFSMNMEKMFKQFDNLFLGIRLLIWIVGLGTLFAGIIGVSNIMMVTVRERTGEIGIRRAIGARPFDIMRQILSESMILTSIAGFLGISFAVLVLQVVNVGISSSADYDAGFQISFGVAVGTAVILMTLGTLAGLAPAFRAMGIKPIEAIREE
jgi:putative ABC transport system permease protein